MRLAAILIGAGIGFWIDAVFDPFNTDNKPPPETMTYDSEPTEGTMFSVVVYSEKEPEKSIPDGVTFVYQDGKWRMISEGDWTWTGPVWEPQQEHTNQ